MIDLHAHTTASDGSATPTELVALAVEIGLAALGITDHDTVGGLEEAVAAAADRGLEVVPGIEISVDYPRPGQFHLLGYFVDYGPGAFRERIEYLQANRSNRNELMMRKFRDAGFDLKWEEIVAESGGGQVGRPHMARAMLKKGYVETVQEAFDCWLADGQPLHVPKVKLSPQEAIDLVHSGGGVAVLAHPKFLQQPDPDLLADELAQYAEMGLDGLECYYSQHRPEETEQYLGEAKRLGLLVTAGSDFHGVSKPRVHLGQIYRGAPGAPQLLEALKARAVRA